MHQYFSHQQHKWLLVLVLMAAIISTAVLHSRASTVRNIELISIQGGATQGDNDCFNSAISDDGLYVAFESLSTSWGFDDSAPDCDNDNCMDIFVRDRQNGQLEKISVDYVSGETGNGDSSGPSLSNDGRYVIFSSRASNLAGEADVGNFQDVFLHDRQEGDTRFASLSYQGKQINGDSVDGIITSDGRYIVFVSNGTNVKPGETNEWYDVYRRSLTSGEVDRISVGMNGEASNEESRAPAVSYDGRYIAFQSMASNLVPNDENGRLDIFLYDANTQVMTRVSQNSEGEGGDGNSRRPQISPTGEFVVFQSGAANLVAGDTNNVDDIFLYQVANSELRRVNLTRSNEQADAKSSSPFICQNGRFISFASESQLIPLDENGVSDIFFYDTLDDEIQAVSVNAQGYWGNENSNRPPISRDCHWVTFASNADNLVEGDDNDSRDIFWAEIYVTANLDHSSMWTTASADAGGLIDYQITVRNTGTELVTATLESEIPYPEILKYVEESGSEGVVYSDTIKLVTWAGSVGSLDEIVVSFRLKVDPEVVETMVVINQAALSWGDESLEMEQRTIINAFHSLLPLISKDS